ncbi:hypothetical protein F4775DRAFT_568041 [Biscogniauxia sp. FL1348]|nr:hypothetical protein F4775DRAFT_568041 [Biscogniauxia sp. FL1348]
MRSFQTVLLAASTVMAANPALMARAPTGSFNLFAYGSDLGGAPVIYDGETVYVGFPSLFNSTEAAPVLFDLSDNVLTGSPNTTTNSSPSWSNVTLFIPSTTSSSHAVGFISGSSSNSSILTSGFMFYGQDVLHKSSSGSLETEWYAVPTGTEHIWTLEWNITSDAVNGTVPVSLRSAKPSTPISSVTDSTDTTE